jgi:nucleoside phosphorylase
MTIWRQTIIELHRLLARHGAFRDVRLWELDTNDASKVRLYAGAGQDVKRRQTRSELELIDTSSRCLVLVVTDCVSAAWHSSAVTDILAKWGRYNPVTLLQVLPRRLWSRTALGVGTPVRLHALTPGSANSQLHIQSTQHWDDEEIMSTVPIPIVTLEPRSLDVWAQAIARAEDVWIPGFELVIHSQIVEESQKAEKQEQGNYSLYEQALSVKLSAAERVQRFRANASTSAWRLAGLLATLPITFPIVRLVQEVMFHEPQQIHVAEVFLSGLLEIASAYSDTLEPDEVQYDYVNGVREILLNSLPPNDSSRVLTEISSLITSKFAHPLDFGALLANPLSKEGIVIDKENRPFAFMGAEALRRFGGEYVALANWLAEESRNFEEDDDKMKVDADSYVLEGLDEQEQVQEKGTVSSEQVVVSNKVDDSTEKGTIEKHPLWFDVCIVCALLEEARAVLHVVAEQCHVTFAERSSPRYQYGYHAATIPNYKGEPLELHLSWLQSYGPQQMIQHLERVLEEYQPRLVLMTGICAGDAQEVQLGDLVVAERVFTYDNRKITRDEQGRTVRQHDTITYQLNANLQQFLGLFDVRESLVMGLKRPSSPSHQFSRSQVRCHIKPMASASAVRADRPFEEVRVPVRGTVAIDMESAALGMVMSDHPLIPWLVVKGVCDYADSQKDDTYHDFAARASALYALSCIQNYVTNERLPPHLPADKQPKFLNFPRRNPHFTGREAFLQNLHKTLNVDNSVILTYGPKAISGMGGIGKTQAAIEYAYRYRHDYETVLWVRADTTADFLSSFTDIVDRLGLLEKREQSPQRVVTAVKQWLEAHTKWLLIFDNADELKVVQNFLPQTLEQGQHTLLTTRKSAVGQIAIRIEIDTMTEDECSLFLLRRVRKLADTASLDDVSEGERSDARKIVQELRGLPLALEQAGAYIESTSISMKEYLDRYQTYRLNLLKRSNDKPPDYNYTVATTWSVSFQRVNEANPAATELLRLCAFLDPDAIPEEIIAGGTQTLGPVLGPLSSEELRMDEIREELLRFSLVRRNSSTKTLTIHRLVQAVIRDNMDEEMQRTWAERAIHTVNHAFPKKVNDIKTWDQCRRYLPHAVACAKLITDYELVFFEAAQLLNQIGYYLREQARYRDAEEYFQQALAISEKLGPEHLLYTAQILNNLARLYFDQYIYVKAEPSMREH